MKQKNYKELRIFLNDHDIDSVDIKIDKKGLVFTTNLFCILFLRLTKKERRTNINKIIKFIKKIKKININIIGD